MNQAEVARFVEEVGVMLELEAGTPRMVGRILGWLLICDPPEQSAGDLARALHASKGSISTATRVLLRLGFVVRWRLPGERFDRFRAQPEAWEEFFWRSDQFGGGGGSFVSDLTCWATSPPSAARACRRSTTCTRGGSNGCRRCVRSTWPTSAGAADPAGKAGSGDWSG